jgi:glycosyltransferase involved in cell wall biosynthesis
MERSGHSWADLTADIARLGGGADGAKARVAIASYEFVGVVRNGGIGTANTELGLALARDGHEVDFVFTGIGDAHEAEFERWRQHYLERGVRLHRTAGNAGALCDSVIHNAKHSLALYRTLKALDEEKPYDVIHFVESLGHGFYSLLAKRNGLAFSQATTVVCTHSPRRWLAEAHQMPFAHPDELSDEFLENRSLELADVVISPSAHMLDWLRDRGVKLPERSYVQQYVTYFDHPRTAATADGREGGAGAVEELVFFGRLEPRKGILTFCDALDLLAADPPPALRRVTLLGKESVPRETLQARARNWPWPLELRTDLDRDAALAYLSQPGRLAVMASTKDNSPNVVYEAIGLGLPFLASRGGGTAELVHPDDFDRVTYDPEDPELTEVDPADPSKTQPVHSGRVLARRLAQALTTEPRPARFAVEPAANRETHVAWHRAVAAAGSAPLTTPRPSPAGPVEARALPSIAPGAELVLLRDPDVEVQSRCGEALAAAAASSGAAFVTSLGSFGTETPEGIEERLFLPTGGPAVMGVHGNCAGAGVAVARRDALERLGVLADPAGAPLSVTELLSRAVLAGERVDVIPEALHRIPASAIGPDRSFARSQDPVELIRPYYLGLPPEARDIAACAARFYREEPYLRRAAAETSHLHELYSGLVTSRGQRAIRAVRHPGRALRRLLRRSG